MILTTIFRKNLFEENQENGYRVGSNQGALCMPEDALTIRIELFLLKKKKKKEKT